MKIDVILGLQWGDEGKGKIVDYLTPNYDIIARFQGGPNAGHTLEFDGGKHILHTIPSGIFHRDKINLIGNGVLIDANIFMKEVNQIREKGFEPIDNLKIALKAHFILPTHRLLDAANEQAKGKDKIGSTLKGIGPAYTDKTSRSGLRISSILAPNFKEKYQDLKEKHLRQLQAMNFDWQTATIDQVPFAEYETAWLSAAEELKKFDLIRCEYFINDALKAGKKILAEGAQGSLLDVDFGTYPFVTSSNTITAGVCTGLGVAPSQVGKVFGIFKAYCTRVGSGPFPTELHDATGERLQQCGHEFGSVTGRPRRCGWLDLVALDYSIMINGVTDLIATKIDVLDEFDTIKMANKYLVDGKTTTQFPETEELAVAAPQWIEMQGWNEITQEIKTYDKLPEAMKKYLSFVEEQCGRKVSIISTGPDRTQTIIR